MKKGEKMKAEEKAKIVVGMCAEVTHKIIEHYQKRHPGRCITKPDLFPAIGRHVGSMMETSDDTVFEDEAIGPPDELFLYRHWKEIKLIVAMKYKKYIIPGTDGFRMGTLEEWCSITEKKDMPIIKGIARSASKRSRIARDHGGVSPTIESGLKQLPPGDASHD